MHYPDEKWHKNDFYAKWSVNGASVRGYSHLKSGAPRQDAADFRQTADGEALIVAVADGHGSKDCPLSDRGAMFAVESALEYLENLYEMYKAEGEDGRYFKKEWFLKREHLVYRWQQRVEEDWQKQEKEEPENLYLQYGTTILAALFTPKFAFVLHLGDGDIIYLDAAGNVQKPLPEDPLCHQNVVTSLCLSQSWEHIRVKLIDTQKVDPKVFMFSTDGYNDSFENEKDFFEDIKVYWTNFLEEQGETEKFLPEWLENISKNGSGDDISTVLVFFNDHKKVEPKLSSPSSVTDMIQENKQDE